MKGDSACFSPVFLLVPFLILPLPLPFPFLPPVLLFGVLFFLDFLLAPGRRSWMAEAQED